MKRRISIWIALILFSVAPPLPAQSTLQPTEHPVYDFLDRMDVLGMLNSPLQGSKPLTRCEIASLLEEALLRAMMQPQKLSRVDLELLSRYRAEFLRDGKRNRSEISPALESGGRTRWGRISIWMEKKRWFTGSLYRNGWDLYSYESDAFDASVNPRGSARIIRLNEEEKTIVITAVGVQMRGYAGKHLGILFDFLDTSERGRGPYYDRSQLYQENVGYVGGLDSSDVANYDAATLDFTVGGKLSQNAASAWELHLAKMPLRWGAGRSGQLLLSDQGPGFHQVQFGLKLLSRLRLVYIFGVLQTYPEWNDTLYVSAGYTRTIERSKYLTAHRLEWDPHPRWRFAFSESVIFGERGVELAYLIPVNYFHAAQHDLGDEDNALLSLEAEWIPRFQCKLYGQLLIDDITFEKLGSDYYGNKLGWLGGFFWAQPLGAKNFDAVVEMAQLRPFVYSHQYPVNVYKHWNAPLGYRHPPNSTTLYAQLRFRPHHRLEWSGSWIRLIHGTNTASSNVGGDINQPHAIGMSEDAPFLAGERITSDLLDGTLRYEALERFYVWGRCGFRWENSWNDLELEIGFRLN